MGLRAVFLFATMGKLTMNEARYRITKAGAVILHLPHRPQGIEIGWISGGTFHCKRNPQKHFHQKSKSYGFSYDWIRGGNFRFVTVHIISTGEELHTTREVILRRGHFLHFKTYERQIFLRLSDFGRARAEQVAREIATEKAVKHRAVESVQLGLFEKCSRLEREGRNNQEAEVAEGKSGARPSGEVRDLWHE